VILIHQRHREAHRQTEPQWDRRTDGPTTYRAFHYIASRCN